MWVKGWPPRYIEGRTQLQFICLSLTLPPLFRMLSHLWCVHMHVIELKGILKILHKLYFLSNLGKHFVDCPLISLGKCSDGISPFADGWNKVQDCHWMLVWRTKFDPACPVTISCSVEESSWKSSVEPNLACPYLRRASCLYLWLRLFFCILNYRRQFQLDPSMYL